MRACDLFDSIEGGAHFGNHAAKDDAIGYQLVGLMVG